MLDHLFWSTVTAVVAVLAAWCLRGHSAAIRFNILFIALLRFAIPTPWLGEAGSMLAARMPTPVIVVVQRTANAVAAYSMPTPATRLVASVPEERAVADSGSHSAPGTPAPIPVIPILWGLGTLVILTYKARRTRAAAPAVREPHSTELAAFARASDRIGARSTQLRIVTSQLTPCVQGLVHSTVLLPESLCDQLTEAELESVLSHELAHVRRYDNLTALVAQLITAVFWFHPLAILLRYRLLVEREIACDEMVLACGTEREHYMSGIAKVCREAAAPAHGYANFTGSNLKQRLQHIHGYVPGTVQFSARITPAILTIFALLVPATISFLQAQSPSTASKSDGRPRRRVQPYSDSNAGKLLARVEGLVRAGHKDEAQALILAEVPRFKPDPKDGELSLLRMLLMQTDIKVNRLDEAIQITNSLLAEAPVNGLPFGANSRASLYFNLAQIYQRKGDWHSVKSYLELSVHAQGGQAAEQAAEINSYMRTFLAMKERGQAPRYIDRVAPIDPNLAVALDTNTLFPEPTDHVQLKH